MTREVDMLQYKLNAAKVAKTMKGKTLNFVGTIFAVYGIIRILNVCDESPLWIYTSQGKMISLAVRCKPAPTLALRVFCDRINTLS
jgi:hypothetical protein